jgi:DNA-binding transcriptional ArsR family regulator
MGEARLFQALSDPTRLRIVALLGAGPLNVTGIVKRVKATQPAVSRHLRILREVGLIRDKRLGKEVEYSLEAGRVREAAVWLGGLASPREAGVVAGEYKHVLGAGDGMVLEAVERGAGAAGAARMEAGAGGERRVEPHRRTTGKRMRLISPLVARRGMGAGGRAGKEESPKEPAKEPPQAAPAHASRDMDIATSGSKPRPAPEWQAAKRVRGAGIQAGGRRRRKRSSPKQPEHGTGPTPGPKQESPTEPAYIVGRGDDEMDDFLL